VSDTIAAQPGERSLRPRRCGEEGAGAAPAAPATVIADVFRDEAGRLTATLVRTLGDFDLAEDLVQDALVAALEHWPTEGIPRRPGAWLLTTARRKAVDRWRRETRYRERVPLLDAAPLPPPVQEEVEADDRLRLLFICCHPALARDAQIALTLRAVLGLTTAEIARAFLASEATVAQRIVRAKRKIVETGIRYRLPRSDELSARLHEVLTALYVLFNEGYLSGGDRAAARHDLTRDAAWLAGLVARLLPEQPEALGLLALIRLHRARAAARFDAAGHLVLLRDQDRGRWDRAEIVAASALVEAALRRRAPGPYQVQAAIAACHAGAASWDATDWPQILALYGVLSALAPSPIVALNRAIALRYVAGPATALAEVETLQGALHGYHLYHATRAELLEALGRTDAARDANQRALALTANPAERALLTHRLFSGTPSLNDSQGGA